MTWYNEISLELGYEVFPEMTLREWEETNLAFEFNEYK